MAESGKQAMENDTDTMDKTNEDKKTNADKRTKEYTIGGYVFKTKEAATAARDELNAIKYMSAKTDSKDPRQVYILYNSLIDKRLFSTLVGINYLKELQQFLYLSEEIPNDKIRPIAINQDLQNVINGRREIIEHESEFRKLSRERNIYKDRFVKSVIVNIVLVIVIGVIAFITVFSKNANVVNYERNLQDKYATWQEQLESQEASLKARENSLNMK